jgi:hypothetical protein
MRPALKRRSEADQGFFEQFLFRVFYEANNLSVLGSSAAERRKRVARGVGS